MGRVLDAVLKQLLFSHTRTHTSTHIYANEKNKMLTVRCESNRILDTYDGVWKMLFLQMRLLSFIWNIPRK